MNVAFLPFASQLLMMMLLGGGLGIPLGVPPAPDDPLLAAIAPEKCLYYTTWAGMARPDPDSANQTEQLLAEPEIQDFAVQLEARLKQSLARIGQNNRDPQAQLAAELPALGKLLLSRPTAVFVSQADFQRGGLDIRGAMVVNAGDQHVVLRRFLEQFRQTVVRDEATDVTIAGEAFSRYHEDPDAPPITWGFKGDYFVLGVGANAVEGVFERAVTPVPAWLSRLQDQLPLDRRATLTYADLEGLVAAVMPLAGRQGPAIARAAGLNQIGSYAAVTGLDKTGFTSRTMVEVDQGASGLPALLDGRPLAPADLAKIPADATVAVACRLEGAKLLDTILAAIQVVEPRAAEELRAGLGEVERNVNIRVREDLLGSLGDVWHLYTSPREGGLATGWTAAVSVADRAKLLQVNERLIGVMGGLAMQGRRAPRIKSTPFNAHTIHSLIVPDDDFVATPSWCITNDQLVFALFPQAIRAHLSRAAGEPMLADRPEIAPLFAADQGPQSLAYRDSRAIFESVYPLVQFGAQVSVNQFMRGQFDLDMTLLPSASCIGKHLGPAVTSARRTKAGLLIESHQSLPGSSLGAMAPVMTALLLPAVRTTRFATRRTRSLNNLKQIAIALHNYHDTYRGFPAAYNTDQNGKPLLSWRVQILPFIEQQALYEQFRFDEPWDSEHNRRLIRLIPPVYQAPGSEADPGKTNYLGVRGERFAMVAPREREVGKEHPIGTRFAEITDGTANTVAVVEASDALAVIWTKPDDYSPDGEDPVKGLVGLRPGKFLAMFCDGSVRELAATINKTVANALFSRNGGETVNIP